MQKYHGTHPNAGATEFKIKDKSIFVKFAKPKIYEYSYNSCGKKHVEAMKKLAIGRRGLSTYIAQEKPQHVK